MALLPNLDGGQSKATKAPIHSGPASPSKIRGGVSSAACSTIYRGKTSGPLPERGVHRWRQYVEDTGPATVVDAPLPLPNIVLRRRDLYVGQVPAGESVPPGCGSAARASSSAGNSSMSSGTKYAAPRRKTPVSIQASTEIIVTAAPRLDRAASQPARKGARGGRTDRTGSTKGDTE